MKLGQKLFLLFAGVAVIPVVAVAGLGQRAAADALSRSLEENQIRSAQAEAEYLHRYFDELGGELGGALLFGDPAKLDEAHRRELLLRTFLRRDRISVAALFDPEGNEVQRFAVEDPLALAKEEPQTRLHLQPSAEELQDFAARAGAFVKTLSSNRLYAVSDPYLSRTRRRATVLLAAPPPIGRQHALVVELSLQDLSSRLAARFSGERLAFLADGEGRAFLHSSEREVSPAAHGVIPPAAKGAGTLQYEWNGRSLAAAYAPVPELGWYAVVAEPADLVAAPLQALAKVSYAVLLAALVLSGLLAFGVARAFSKPLAALAEGAKRFAQGDDAYRLKSLRRDEIGEVARTFDDMGEAILRARKRLEGFNEELKRQVEERTRELKEAQAQVLRSRHLSGIADFAAGFAHEVNNPLTTVLGSAELGLMDAAPGTEVHELLSAIRKDGLRISAIVKDLQALTEAGRGGRSQVDLNELSRSEVEKFRAELEGAGIKVEYELVGGPLLILAADGALQDLFARVLSNARNAMRDRPERRLLVRTAAVSSEVARLEVVDTGCGIPAEQLERIFNPFFTTKKDWNGRGVSLALCHRVVEAHGGSLQIQSAVEIGTTVKVTLPQAPPPTFMR